MHTFRVDVAGVDVDGTPYAGALDGVFRVDARAPQQTGTVWIVPWASGLRLTVPKKDADFVPLVAPDQNVEFALGFGWYQDDPVFGAISRQMVKQAMSGTVQTVSWDGGPAMPMHYGAVVEECMW